MLTTRGMNYEWINVGYIWIYYWELHQVCRQQLAYGCTHPLIIWPQSMTHQWHTWLRRHLQGVVGLPFLGRGLQVMSSHLGTVHCPALGRGFSATKMLTFFLPHSAGVHLSSNGRAVWSEWSCSSFHSMLTDGLSIPQHSFVQTVRPITLKLQLPSPFPERFWSQVVSPSSHSPALQPLFPMASRFWS